MFCKLSNTYFSGKLLLIFAFFKVAMDGGSPLACESDGHYYLGGMVMFGTACGQDSVPSMFVRVSEYVEWILSSYATLSERNSS